MRIIPLLLLWQFSFGQPGKSVFFINPSTGFVSILDSVKVGVKFPVLRAQDLVTRWASNTAFNNPTLKLFNYSPAEKEVTLSFTTIYETEGHRGKYYKEGQLSYLAKNRRGKTDSTDETNGNVGFTLNFEVRGEYLVLEITKLSYAGLNNELGKFEDRRLLGPDGVHFLSEKQKPWSRIKEEYYFRLRVISQSLKDFIASHYTKPVSSIY